MSTVHILLVYIRVPQPRMLLFPGEIWQSLDISLLVTIGVARGSKKQPPVHTKAFCNEELSGFHCQ